MSLPTATLGKDGPLVNRLGLGLMGLSIAYGTPRPDNERMAFLDHAYDAGERFWDSSDMYGDNEDLLGRWFAANPSKRASVFLATKFAIRRTAAGRSVDSSPAHCKAACEMSLARLGVAHIDLYYCHRVDRTTPIEQTVRAMAELKAQGKIRYLGLSEVSAATLRRACKVHPIAAVQVEYSPFALDIESAQIELLAACRELGVAVVAYSPLCRGMLTGTLTSRDDFADSDFRKHAPRFSEQNFPKNIALAEKIGGMARTKGVTPSQLTLAWLLAQGEDIFPIPGTTKEERLEENIASLKVELSEVEKREIRREAEAAEVTGTRYPADFMQSCYADTPPLEGN